MCCYFGDSKRYVAFFIEYKTLSQRISSSNLDFCISHIEKKGRYSDQESKTKNSLSYLTDIAWSSVEYQDLFPENELILSHRQLKYL